MTITHEELIEMANIIASMSDEILQTALENHYVVSQMVSLQGKARDLMSCLEKIMDKD